MMFERVSADDLMSLASRRHPPPLQVGAVLVLDVRGGLDSSSLRAVLQQRIATVPRLRQRLQKVPLGCGRPVWVEDPGLQRGRSPDRARTNDQRPTTPVSLILRPASSPSHCPMTVPCGLQPLFLP